MNRNDIYIDDMYRVSVHDIVGREDLLVLHQEGEGRDGYRQVVGQLE